MKATKQNHSLFWDWGQVSSVLKTSRLQRTTVDKKTLLHQSVEKKVMMTNSIFLSVKDAKKCDLLFCTKMEDQSQRRVRIQP